MLKVNLFAMLRAAVGRKTVELPIEGETTAGEVLRVLLEHYPVLRPQLVDENGNLYGHIHFFVNGRDVHYTNGHDTLIRPGDTIDIFPPVGGG
ncbi:MAG: MoaD/ThiS family protein [Thermoflexales bacterium]|nr:MoaD/ThiS family protein [Thermoflexales bacterium]MCS7325443.1 MoaD/ThiS family protein [Thermoflexales bacterium]MCX7938138.1 MoaD/ThiS family protein [Thermoflexales bacterium]MDW8054040.1 ubiquitin-like small modifier protein 1 [Anaerolineae bacterium]MDW8292625.1 ubiquitin-like small modifier protein 1 [Anaerolineae bacterium]